MASRRRPTRRPVGLRHRTPRGILEGLRRVGASLLANGEELALGLFFIAFVWFGFQWLMLIFR